MVDPYGGRNMLMPSLLAYIRLGRIAESDMLCRETGRVTELTYFFCKPVQILRSISCCSPFVVWQVLIVGPRARSFLCDGADDEVTSYRGANKCFKMFKYAGGTFLLAQLAMSQW